MPSVFNELLLRLKLRHYLAVDIVDRERSMSHAANSLNTTQPSVTKLIREVEKAIGGEIFERIQGGVRPTMLGKIFLEHIRPILRQNKIMRDRINSAHQGLVGTIEVGVTFIVTPSLIPMALSRVNKSNPQLRIRLTEMSKEQLMPSLRNNKLDLGVARILPSDIPDDLECIPLYDDPIEILASPGLLKKGGKPDIHTLAHTPWVLPPQGTVPRNEIDHFFKINNWSLPLGSIETISLATIRSLLLNGQYFSASPATPFVSEIRQGLIEIGTTRFKEEHGGKVSLLIPHANMLAQSAQAIIFALQKEAGKISALVDDIQKSLHICKPPLK